MRRLVETLRPAWVIGENVAGHVSMGLDDVLSDLGALGYACQALIIPACAVNAPHRRDRVWLVAHATDMQRDGGDDHAREFMGREQVSEPRDGGGASAMADTHCNDVQGFFTSSLDAEEWPGPIWGPAGSCGVRGGWWAVEPDVGRVASRVPNRVDRLKALGNAVVPAIPQMIGHAILQSMKEAA
jgi:DNA (cytosine-5)-methyltransferase 1